MTFARALVLASLVSTSACSTALREAATQLDDGRPGDALRALEPVSEADVDSREAARVALVRGLALYATGDLAAATRWLGALHERLLADPWLLDADDLARFDSAWARLDDAGRQSRE